jgi:hypothetical protein
MSWKSFFLILVLALVLIFGISAIARAESVTDEQVQAFFDSHPISGHVSQLPSFTIGAFSRAHPDFDVSGFLAVMWAESSLGTTCDYKHNPGSIKGGAIGSPWRDLRTGVSRNGYNIYPDMYTGQRAAILLIYSRYNSVLANHQWSAFCNRYYGAGIPGIGGYRANIIAAHALAAKTFH